MKLAWRNYNFYNEMRGIQIEKKEKLGYGKTQWPSTDPMGSLGSGMAFQICPGIDLILC
jgi:hypothetical protein